MQAACGRSTVTAVRRPGRLALAPIGALLATLCLAPLHVGASSAPLRPGAVEEIAAPGMALVTPADGRLRGPQFAADVLGVAWPSNATPVTPAHLVPSAGSRLVVFTLRLTESSSGPIVDATAPPVTADLSYGPGAAAVPLKAIVDEIDQSLGTSGTGTATFVAAVPEHEHRVELTLSQAGFSQSLSLWTLRRVAPSPAVLYRDPSATTIPAATSPSGHLLLSDAATHFSQPALVTTSVAELTDFAPDGSGTTAPGPGKAFLVVQLEADASRGNLGFYLYATSPLPGDRLVLHVPGQRPVTATSSTALNPPASSLDDGLIDATYAFVVPADLTTANLVITPGSTPGEQYEDFHTPGPSSFDVAKGATLTFAFPPPAVIARQATLRWPSVTATPPAPATSHPSPARQPSSPGGLPWPVIVALVLAVGALAVGGLGALARRARRRPSPREVPTADPATTPPGAQPEPAATTEDRGLEPDAEREAPGDPPVRPSTAPTTVGELRPTRLERDGPVVHVLGPVEVTGWKERPSRRVVTELACFLALHDERPQRAETVLSALWPVDADAKEATRQTLQSYVSLLRRALGPEHVPDASATDGYRLEDVDTDWAAFSRLVDEARHEAGASAIERRAAALALVRGVPFAGVDERRFSWVFTEHLATTMTGAIVACAEQLARDLLSVGDHAGAEAAARAGLRASPHEEPLWQLLLDAAHAGPAHARLLAGLQDAERTLGRARGLELRRQYLSGNGAADHRTGSTSLDAR